MWPSATQKALPGPPQTTRARTRSAQSSPEFQPWSHKHSDTTCSPQAELPGARFHIQPAAKP